MLSDETKRQAYDQSMQKTGGNAGGKADGTTRTPEEEAAIQNWKHVVAGQKRKAALAAAAKAEKARAEQAELAKMAAYGDERTWRHVQHFINNRSNSNEKMIIDLLGQRPALISQILKDIPAYALTGEKGLGPLFNELLPEPYREKMVPHYILAFNQTGNEYAAKSLMSVLGQSTAFASQILQELPDYRVIGDQALSAKLAELQPDAYREKTMPCYVNAFNTNNGYGAQKELIGFLEQRPDLASQMIEELSAVGLHKHACGSEGGGLNAKLAELQPKTYREKMVPYYVKSFNMGGSTENGMAVAKFVLQAPEQAQEIKDKIDTKHHDTLDALISKAKEEVAQRAEAKRAPLQQAAPTPPHASERVEQRPKPRLGAFVKGFFR